MAIVLAAALSVPLAALLSRLCLAGIMRVLIAGDDRQSRQL